MSFFVASSDDYSIENYFNGVAFSDEAIIVSLYGLLDYIKEGGDVNNLIDGRFSMCLKMGEERIFATDGAGQDCWFYYSDSDFWLVSNSLYAAAEKLKEKKGKIFFNESASLFYNIKHSLGDQPCNDNTMVEGIRILPRNSIIKARGSKLSVSRFVPPVKIGSEEEYKEKLVNYVEIWKSRLHTLFGLFESGTVRCDISGGIDSRIVMGLTNPISGVYNIKYSSNMSWCDDYLIASLLAKKNGFRINNSDISLPRTISADEALELYIYGNSGTYKNVYWPKHLKKNPSMHLHGAGGENIRGLGSGSAWMVVNRLKKFFRDSNDFESFKEEYLSWFDKNDVDCRSEESTIIHYRNFRSRFHFGRNWFRSLTNPMITPLASLTFETMADYMISKGRNPKSLQFDILYLCEECLPFFPFDDEMKKFELNIIEDSFEYLNDLSKGISTKSIKVYGDLDWMFNTEVSGVSDKSIIDKAYLEVDEFLSGSEKNSFSSLSHFLFDPSEKLRKLGLVSMLKLF